MAALLGGTRGAAAGEGGGKGAGAALGAGGPGVAPPAPGAGGRAEGQGLVRARQTPRQRGNHRPRRPRQNHPDGRHHQDPGGLGLGAVPPLRGHRLGPRGASARHHHQRRPRRVRDAGAALRPHRLPRPRRLRQEHDHGHGPPGRSHPGGGGHRRADAPDPRAPAAGQAGRGGARGGLREQGGRGVGPGAAGAGGAGGPRAAARVRLRRRQHPRHLRLRALRPPGPRPRAGAELGAAAARGHRPAHPGARPRPGAPLPAAHRGRALHPRPRDGGDGDAGAGDAAQRGRGGDPGLQPPPAQRGHRDRDVPQEPGSRRGRGRAGGASAGAAARGAAPGAGDGAAGDAAGLQPPRGPGLHPDPRRGRPPSALRVALQPRRLLAELGHRLPPPAAPGKGAGDAGGGRGADPAAAAADGSGARAALHAPRRLPNHRNRRRHPRLPPRARGRRRQLGLTGGTAAREAATSPSTRRWHRSRGDAIVDAVMVSPTR